MSGQKPETEFVTVRIARADWDRVRRQPHDDHGYVWHPAERAELVDVTVPECVELWRGMDPHSRDWVLGKLHPNTSEVDRAAWDCLALLGEASLSLQTEDAVAFADVLPLLRMLSASRMSSGTPTGYIYALDAIVATLTPEQREAVTK